MDIAGVSTAMSGVQLSQSMDIAVIKSVQDFTEAISQELLEMLDVGVSPHMIDIEV